jgi:hypothetical protein
MRPRCRASKAAHPGGRSAQQWGRSETLRHRFTQSATRSWNGCRSNTRGWMWWSITQELWSKSICYRPRLTIRPSPARSRLNGTAPIMPTRQSLPLLKRGTQPLIPDGSRLGRTSLGGGNGLGRQGWRLDLLSIQRRQGEKSHKESELLHRMFSPRMKHLVPRIYGLDRELIQPFIARRLPLLGSSCSHP